MPSNSGNAGHAGLATVATPTAPFAAVLVADCLPRGLQPCKGMQEAVAKVAVDDLAMLASCQDGRKCGTPRLKCKVVQWGVTALTLDVD